MGVLEDLGLKKKKMKFVDEPGKEYGWNVASGKQLEARLEVLDTLNILLHAPLTGKTPTQQLEYLKKKIQLADQIVRQSSMAWARAGSDPRYRRAVSGYEGLLTGCIRDCDLIISGLNGEDPTIQKDVVRHIERVCNISYFQHSMLLVDVTFNDKDITPTLDKTLVFPPGNQPFGGFAGGISTSGGRVSEETTLPPRGPYPDRMSSRIKRREDDGYS